MEENNSLDLKKKEHSYTYWVKPNNPDVKIDIAPQKLEKPIEANQDTKGLGPSSWNVSGTWEERKIPIKELQAKINEVMKGCNTTDKKATVTEVTVSGQAGLVFSRGKKGLTYELKINIAYKGLQGFQDAQGQLIFDQFTDGGDREASIKSKGQANKDIVKSSIIKDKGIFTKYIETEINKYKD